MTNTPSRCRVVFLDAGTLPCGLPFAERGLDAELLARIDYQPHERTLPDQVASRIADAEIVVVNKVRIDGALMDQAPRLQRICVSAAGTDNVDLQAARERGIAVHNVPDYGSDSVAEHVIATLLALRRHLFDYSRASQDGRWQASPHFCWHGPRIRPVAGSTLGIVGRGRIGQATARFAEGLGMRVLFAERPLRPERPERPEHTERPGDTTRPAASFNADERPLDTLLAECDAISLHVPLTPETRGMMDARRLAAMKPDAVLINTGRGALVDAGALADALRSGRLAGAAIDVLDVEPPPASHPLLDATIPNLLLTPHVAWASEVAQRRLADLVVDRVVEHLAQRGQPARATGG